MKLIKLLLTLSILTISLSSEETKRMIQEPKIDIKTAIENNDEYILSIIRTGDIESFKLLIKDLKKVGYDINYSNPNFRNSKSLIEMSLEEKKPKIIKYLLENDAKFDTNPSRFPAIYTATSLGYIDIVKILIEKGSDPYYIAVNKHYHLYWSLGDLAQKNEHPKLVEYFSTFKMQEHLLAKFKTNSMNYDERTWLIMSYIKEENTKKLDLFKDSKALNEVNFEYLMHLIKADAPLEEFTPSLNMIEYYNINIDKYDILTTIDNEKIFNFLLEKYNTKGFFQTQEAYDTLLYIIKSNDTKSLKRFLDNDIILHVEGKQAPFSFAVDYSNNETIKLLLTYEKVETDSVNSRKQTPVEYLIIKDNLEILKLLLPKKKNVNKARLLYFGIHSKNIETFKYLAKEIKLDKNDFNKPKILSKTIELNNYPVVSYMLDNGADVHYRNENNVTLLSEAVFSADFAMVKLLINKGLIVSQKNDNYVIHDFIDKYVADNKEEITQEKKNDDIKMINFLVKHDLPLDQCMGRHTCETPIFKLLGEDQYEVALLLVDLNATVEESDISYLIDKKAPKKLILKFINAYKYHFQEDITQRWFPMFPALKYGDNEITKLLIDKGFTDLSWPNCNDWTLFQILASEKHYEILNYLLTKDVCSHAIEPMQKSIKYMREKTPKDEAIDILESFLERKKKECK